MRSKIKQVLKKLFFICLGYGIYCNTHALDDVHLQPWFDLSNAHNNAWTISGLLHNEQDDYYGFMMILERQEQVLHVLASLYDLNEKKLIWHQEETQYLELDKPYSQSLKGFYWHFSPINQSFVLAYQDEKTKKQTFNLKMDLMQPIVVTPKISLTPTLKVKQYWSGSINGHIHMPDEQFVTSASVWVQNIWQNNKDTQTHPFSEILCQFQDGGAMFAIQAPEKNGLHAAIAGLYDKDGQRQTMSQFVNLSPPSQDDYEIKLSGQKEILQLHLLFHHPRYHALLANRKSLEQNGFCIYANQSFGNVQSPQIQLPLSSAIHKLNFFEKTVALVQKPFKIPFIMKNKESS